MISTCDSFFLLLPISDNGEVAEYQTNGVRRGQLYSDVLNQIIWVHTGMNLGNLDKKELKLR